MVYPAPPSSWTASVVTCMAASEAKSFAIADAFPPPGAPTSAIEHARYTRRRAASTRVAMSASMNWMPWKSAIDEPNCFRSVVYCTAASSAPCAIPTAWAPTIGREPSSASIA